MLLSVDDFAFAFDDDEDLEAKVKTGLMMIEKDYLAKFHYNVVIARSKSLFSIVYALKSRKKLGGIICGESREGR